MTKNNQDSKQQVIIPKILGFTTIIPHKLSEKDKEKLFKLLGKYNLV